MKHTAEERARRLELKYLGAKARHAKRSHILAKLRKARNEALKAGLGK